VILAQLRLPLQKLRNRMHCACIPYFTRLLEGCLRFPETTPPIWEHSNHVSHGLKNHPARHPSTRITRYAAGTIKQRNTAHAVASGKGPPMVNHCANPQCCKPLHYLREGRVYVFDVTRSAAGNSERTARRMEHFWLCGVCSETYFLEQVEDRTVRISPRIQRPVAAVLPYKVPQSIAS
jgi:hypothetical protein